ncbi:MAG: DEAD/DEAH box helicase family protein [Deltaproteobacteria bacterium]|nr:DEAD/DEAH box helicase family protein [Deltaproteobacteria bacterium]
MKLKFKKQAYQADAVDAVCDCFAGQPKSEPQRYRIDPGVRKESKGQTEFQTDPDLPGFRNEELRLTEAQLLANIHEVQHRQNMPLSPALVKVPSCPINLDVEMETGTGKTYCYIKTMFEMNRRFGWSKFVVVVPSIAIREGVSKSFEITAEHFLEEYGQRIRSFIYDSKQLHKVESFSSDGGINVMIVNAQAFAARGKDARRIYEELDDFNSRRPIDVIKKNHPVLILDEPQKLEGKTTKESLKEFNALAVLRYSATHKTEHNKVYRLDALDAYNQKLVKKIAVRGISVKGLSGTTAYLYLESIQISAGKPPVARMEFEEQQVTGIRRKLRLFSKGDKLYELSGKLDQYNGFTVTEIDAVTDTVTFSNGQVLHSGEATGNVDEPLMRRIQIREAVRAHFEREQNLFYQGIKTLSLFFIDEVAKYRRYEEGEEQAGDYAQMFEEEYRNILNELLELEDSPYKHYLQNIPVHKTHDGYFSIDKKSKHLVDPTVKKRSEETDDADAYDLILKNKERLLSFEEPVRFIFSHSALSEGWDNPNVFVICTLKHSDSTIRKRQEVGRGLRLCVNQDGDRIDSGANVHQTNVLTVVASESYRDFTAALQKEIIDSLSARPRKADVAYFSGKVMRTTDGLVSVTPEMANQLYRYLVKNDYTDEKDAVTKTYHEAKEAGELAPLPEELQPYAPQIVQLIDSVFSEAVLPGFEDDRNTKINPLNKNFEKAEFKALWEKINRKAAYTVQFDTEELIGKCVDALNSELTVARLQYTVERGAQKGELDFDAVKGGESFVAERSETGTLRNTVHSAVRYDLLGKLAEDTRLTRKTVAAIMKKIRATQFVQFRANPEDFLNKAVRIIKEQKATVIVEHLAYDPVEERHDINVFTAEKPKENFSRAVKTDRHIYDYVFTDSTNEKNFVQQLDISSEVVVYAKLPRGFTIPTPVGEYNPDWAISFKEGSVKHIYFIAETKGSMSSMELRKIEECKIECAKKFFIKITTDQVKYDVVNSYGKLMELVN